MERPKFTEIQEKWLKSQGFQFPKLTWLFWFEKRDLSNVKLAESFGSG